MKDAPQPVTKAFVRAMFSNELLADAVANFNARDVLVYRLHCFFLNQGLHMFWWKMLFEPAPDGFGDEIQVTVVGKGCPNDTPA